MFRMPSNRILCRKAFLNAARRGGGAAPPPLTTAPTTTTVLLRLTTPTTIPAISSSSSSLFRSSPTSTTSSRCGCCDDGIITTPLRTLFMSSAARRQQRGGSRSDDDDDFDGSFAAFAPGANLARDTQALDRDSAAEQLVQQLLPTFATDDIRQRVRSALMAHPIDDMIMNGTIVVTHQENDEGQDVKVSSKPITIMEARAMARELGDEEGGGGQEEYSLVQMAERDTTSYCRLRREKRRILATVQADLDALAAKLGTSNPVSTAAAGDEASGSSSSSSTTGSRRPPPHARDLKPKPLVVHAFRDVVDAHFIGWRSKKIVNDLKRRHPCKIVIQQFQSPEAAIAKMQEMMNAIRAVAVAENVIHFFSGIGTTATELTVSLQPVLDTSSSKVKAVKHPSQGDWDHAERRLSQLTGGRGTYQKSNVLKAHATMAREFRVDRFGRRLDDK